MRLFVLFSLALLCAGLATALPQLHCKKWQCSPFMLKEIRPGSRLVYDYRATASAFLPGKTTPVILNILTEVTFDFYSCRRTLKLSRSRITSRDGSLRGSNKDFQSLVAALEKNVLYFRSNDGAVDGLCSKDEPWVTNFKRGLLSVFQQPRSPIRKNIFQIQMIDIHGSCPARIERLGNRVLMRRKLDACTNRHRSFGGLQSEAYSAPSPVQNPGLGSNQLCEFKFGSARRRILRRATCNELLTFKAPMTDSLLPQGSARVSQELKLKRTTTFKCASGCRNFDSLTSYRASGLEMEFEEAKRPTEAFKTATDLLCRVAGPVRPENPELFSRLVIFLRSAKQSDWDKLTKAKPRSLCPKRQAKAVTAALLEGLAEAGDSRSVRFLTRSGLSDAQKDRLLSALAFARRPGLLLPHIRPIFERFHRLPRASLAAAALVHRFCAARKDRCDQHKVVRRLLAPLERTLKTKCDRLPLAKGVLLFRVLGNLRTPQRLHRKITDCAEHKKTPVELRVAAIQALRRSGCPSPRTALLRILSSPKYDSETRVAAYHALLVCRDARLAVSLRRALLRIKAAHVSSYIASHMANLRANTDPDQTSLRHFLHDVRYSPRHQGGLSRHLQQSYYSPGSNLGVRSHGALVWSEKSPSPRSVRAGLTGQLFGRSVPLMEMRGRFENLYEIKTRNRVPYAQRKYLKLPKATAELGLRFFGHDLVAKRMEVKPKDYRYSTFRMFFKKTFSGNFKRNCMFADFSTAFASGAGLPLRLSFVGAASAALEVISKDRGPPRKWESEGGIKPELALRSEMSAAFELPGMQFGGRASGTAQTRTEWRAKILVERRKFTLRIKAPEKQEALNLRWSVVSLHVTKATPVARLAPSPAFSWRSKTRLGYQAVVEVQNRPGTPESRGNNRIAVLLERRDSHKYYVLALADTRKIRERTLLVRMDMEGSRQNRALEGTIKYDNREASIFLKGERRRFEGSLGCKRFGWRQEKCFVTGRNEKGILVDLTWDMSHKYSKGVTTSIHKIRGRVGKQSLGQLDLQVTKKSRVVAFWARLKDVLRKPMELSGSITRIRANRRSVGEMQSVALNFTSSFLRADLTSKVDTSPRKFGALVQTGYVLPGARRETASAKISWLRLTNAAFRDKLTFKSSSSQNPMLNVDLTLKSSIKSATDFRTALVLKSWPRYVPVSATMRFLLDRVDRDAQSLVFQSSYILDRSSSGEAALVCEWNRKHVSFVTLLKHKCRSGKAINWNLSVKKKTNNEIDASVTFSSDRTPYSLNSTLRRPANGGLSFLFRLKPDIDGRIIANPFYRTILLEANNAGWTAKADVRNGFPYAINATLFENSRYQMSFGGSYSFRGDDFKLSNRLTSRKEQIYSLVLAHSRAPNKCSGSLNFGIGAEGNRNQFKASYMLDARKNLHNSQVELLMGLASASLRNDYSYEMSAGQQKLNGRSHLTSTFGGLKRKLMLQTSMNNLPDQFNSDLQFSSSLNDKPSFVNFKVNVKDKNVRSLAWTVTMDSSIPKARSAELDYSHQFGKRSFQVTSTARYLKKSLTMRFGSKGRKELTGNVGLDLGESKFKTDISLKNRRFASKLVHLMDGVEFRTAELKFSADQPSFLLELREDGEKTQRSKVFFAREGNLWTAMTESVTPYLNGKAEVKVGIGYRGHIFYLASFVEGGMGVPLLSLNMNIDPNNEVQADGDCRGLVPTVTPCEFKFDFQKKILIMSVNAGPAAFNLQTIPMDESLSFKWKGAPVKIMAKRKDDQSKIQTDIFGYGLRFVCKETRWEKNMTITQAGFPVFKAHVTQRTADEQDYDGPLPNWLARNFLCVPPPVFRVLSTKFKSSSPVGKFEAEGSWDDKAGQIQAGLRGAKTSVKWQTGPSPSGKLALSAKGLESELEASAVAQSFRLRPVPGTAVPSVDLRSRVRPGAWDLNFNVSVNKPKIERCSASRTRCSSFPGYDWNLGGRVWFAERFRYGGFKYAAAFGEGTQAMWQATQEYRYEKNLLLRKSSRKQNIGRTKLDFEETLRLRFSDAGQLNSAFHKVVSGYASGPNAKRAEKYAHVLSFNSTGGRFEMRGDLQKKLLASEPGTNRVVSLRLQLHPSPSLRLRTGLARRVLGSVVRFDLTGSGTPSNGVLGLKTRLAERPYMDCSLRTSCDLKRNKHFFEFQHTRMPRQGPKVTLNLKLDRSPASAEQSIEVLHNKKQMLATKYSRTNKDVSLGLTMFGKKHFQGGWKQLKTGYEVLAQSVTMKQPLSLRFMRPTVSSATVELRTGSDRTPLVLKMTTPRPSLYAFYLRRGKDRIASGSIRPYGSRNSAQLDIGRFSASGNLKRGYFSAFELQVKGPAALELSFERKLRVTSLRASSDGLQLLSVSLRSGPKFSLDVGQAGRLTLDGGLLQMFWKKQQLVRVIFKNPAPQTVSASLFWRPQLVRLAVNEAMGALDLRLPQFCSAVQREGKKLGVQLTAKLPEMPPFRDVRTSFVELGKVLRMQRVFKSVDFIVQVGVRRTAFYVRRGARALAKVACNMKAKSAVVGLRPSIYGLGDRFTTLQAWPDRMARKFGRLVNGIAQFALRRVIRDLEEMRIARPNLSPLLPSPRTLRFVQKKMNDGLVELKAVTMLKGMEQLDRKLLKSLQQAASQMVKTAKQMNLQRDLEKVVRSIEQQLKQVDAETWRLQLVRFLRAMFARVRGSPLAADLLRSAGYQLNEATRGVLKMAVPRIEQLNWRHGRARVLLHFPERPLRLARPALPPPPIDLRRALPGYFRPKVAALYSNFVHTFDQRNFFLPRTCARVVLARYRHSHFGWDITALRQGPRFQLKVRLGKKVFTISQSGVRETGTDTTARARLWTRGGMRFLNAYRHGFELETRPLRAYVRVRLLSPHYFKKMEGLWGNNDELPNNDWAVPGKPYNYQKKLFLKTVTAKCY